jgi:hypothetical protein
MPQTKTEPAKTPATMPQVYRVKMDQAGPFLKGRLVNAAMIEAVGFIPEHWLRIEAIEPVDPSEVDPEKLPRMKVGDQWWQSPEVRKVLNAYEDALDELDAATGAVERAQDPQAHQRLAKAKADVERRREKLVEPGAHSREQEVGQIEQARAERLADLQTARAR